jgi:hypothetical protein
MLQQPAQDEVLVSGARRQIGGGGPRSHESEGDGAR